MKLWHA